MLARRQFLDGDDANPVLVTSICMVPGFSRSGLMDGRALSGNSAGRKLAE
jgi:hypothetical protein